MAGFVYGVAHMPLSTAYAIVFVSPGMDGIAPGPGLVLVLAALCYSIAVITVRKLAQRTDTRDQPVRPCSSE